MFYVFNATQPVVAMGIIRLDHISFGNEIQQLKFWADEKERWESSLTPAPDTYRRERISRWWKPPVHLFIYHPRASEVVELNIEASNATNSLWRFAFIYAARACDTKFLSSYGTNVYILYTPLHYSHLHRHSIELFCRVHSLYRIDMAKK